MCLTINTPAQYVQVLAQQGSLPVYNHLQWTLSKSDASNTWPHSNKSHLNLVSNFHTRIDSSWNSCSNHHVTVCHYHIARNFQRRKLSQIARLCCAKDVPPQISLRKLSWIATKPQNSWKLSPSKVFSYTVFSLILSTCLITCCSFLILVLAKSYTQYQKLWS